MFEAAEARSATRSDRITCASAASAATRWAAAPGG